jgi:polyhydroxybutyrate depolymerase
VADREGFIVGYPDGTGPLGLHTWNGGGCCGAAVDDRVDDVGFGRGLIDDAQTQFNIDTQRVFATGLSNGGIFAQRLACELADRITAIAPMSGGLNFGGDFTVCHPARRLPIIEFHGTTDENYPYNGGVGDKAISGTDFAPIPATIHDWGVRYGYPDDVGRVTLRAGIETCVERGPTDAPKIVLCTADPGGPPRLNADNSVVDGGGHTVPGGAIPGYASADIPPTDLSAAETMWAFFKTAAPGSGTPPEPVPAPTDMEPLARAGVFPNPYSKQGGEIAMGPLPAGAEITVRSLDGQLLTSLVAGADGLARRNAKDDNGGAVAAGRVFRAGRVPWPGTRAEICRGAVIPAFRLQ